MALPRILYVDDEPINLELLQLTFMDVYDILTAVSADHGLEILRSDPEIRVIISDLKMPGMNGLEFIRKIKSQDRNKVCMLLTGYMESEIMFEAFNNELIFRYLVKPWKKDELKEIIDEALYQQVSERN